MWDPVFHLQGFLFFVRLGRMGRACIRMKMQLQYYSVIDLKKIV